jgi:hypothetical protein
VGAEAVPVGRAGNLVLLLLRFMLIGVVVALVGVLGNVALRVWIG